MRSEKAPVAERVAGGSVPVVPLRARRLTSLPVISQSRASPLRGSYPQPEMPLSVASCWPKPSPPAQVPSGCSVRATMKPEL
ncbi:hypothetical protein FEM03_17395 [Phragmitibacter flavus]|uniref:Uncharacterized protein n=1 Tax=Phragmitibacter flavus TaxID=2576071 RepID=A0A5R8KCU9_9BACT|nr:hypothetical protein FEM03_17395 [Phragmitibacter flavus]